MAAARSGEPSGSRSARLLTTRARVESWRSRQGHFSALEFGDHFLIWHTDVLRGRTGRSERSSGEEVDIDRSRLAAGGGQVVIPRSVKIAARGLGPPAGQQESGEVRFLVGEEVHDGERAVVPQCRGFVGERMHRFLGGPHRPVDRHLGIAERSAGQELLGNFAGG